MISNRFLIEMVCFCFWYLHFFIHSLIYSFLYLFIHSFIPCSFLVSLIWLISLLLICTHACIHILVCWMSDLEDNVGSHWYYQSNRTDPDSSVILLKNAESPYFPGLIHFSILYSWMLKLILIFNLYHSFFIHNNNNNNNDNNNQKYDERRSR